MIRFFVRKGLVDFFNLKKYGNGFVLCGHMKLFVSGQYWLLLWPRALKNHSDETFFKNQTISSAKKNPFSKAAVLHPHTLSD